MYYNQLNLSVCIGNTYHKSAEGKLSMYATAVIYTEVDTYLEDGDQNTGMYSW